MDIQMINNSLCMARKNAHKDIYKQCNYKPRYGEYCGFHKHNRIRVDEPIPQNILKTLKNKNIIKTSDANIKPKFKLILKTDKINDNLHLLEIKKLLTLDDYVRNKNSQS